MLPKVLEGYNKLQDVFGKLSYDISFDIQKEIQLPQIVVVGAQSTGKSSTIESIVRQDFLPRGEGIVTRCPLILQLIHCPLDDKTNRGELDFGDVMEEWGVFAHKPKNPFYDFDDIRSEIEEYTNELAGDNKGIVPATINLKIYSPKVVNLTLVDLPGLTKISVGDQPENIEDQILDLINTYAANQNSIILAVSAANADVATSESLKIAKKYDPEGERTLAILTKLDKIESVEQTSNILTGKLGLNIPGKLGIIGIINRSSNQMNGESSFEKQLEIEKKYLYKKFPDIAHRNGVPYLEKSLSDLLMRHIHKCLPGLKQQVLKNLDKYSKVLETCGAQIQDKNRALLKIVTNFVKDFESTINGTTVDLDVESENLIGGPAIRKIFDELLSKQMEAVEPQISQKSIIDYMKKIGGPRPSVFAPEILFESIVKKQISRLRHPALKCAENVQKEMERIIKHSVKAQPEIERFPALMRKINDIMMKLLTKRTLITKQYLEDIMATELASINTNHPNFSIQTVLKEYEQKENDMNNNNVFPEKDEKKLQARKIEKDALIIEKLIREYFNLEKMKIEDSIPKSIMFSLVNYIKENAQSELLSVLGKDEENLLAESVDITNKRERAELMLKTLYEADETIDTIFDC